MKVNPNVFFKFHDGKFVVWNYRAHEQYELTWPYLERLYALATSGGSSGASAAASDAATEAVEASGASAVASDAATEATGDAADRDPSQIDQELAAAGLLAASYPSTSWGWDSLSHMFHFGTNSVLAEGTALPREDSAGPYIDYCSTISDEEPEVVPTIAGEVFELPAPDLEPLKRRSLWDALTERKTAREFTREPIDLATASSILYATFGAVHGPDRSDVRAFGIKSYGYRRTSPSGGSLQTTEPYLVNFTISGLPVGIYHYHSIQHRLTRITGELPAGDLGPLLAGQNFANDLGFAVFMVARFDKMWWKYPHSRSYRVALLDVGHLSQTFHLACTAYSLKTWLTGVFYDEEIARRLGLDLTREAAILLVGAGTGEGKAIGPAILDALRSR